MCYNICMIKKILKENYIYLIIICLMMILFSIIMRSSLHDKIILFDYKIINLVNTLLNDKIVNVFKIITFFGDFYIPCTILVCILLFFKNKWVFLLQGSGYLLAGIITYLAKLFVGRARPIEALIEIPKSFSFPSGHTLTSIVFYVLLCFILTYNMSIKKRRILIIITFIFVLLIAASRVYLGVHYISDIIGGVLIGVPVLLMCLNIINKNFSNKLLKNK